MNQSTDLSSRLLRALAVAVCVAGLATGCGDDDASYPDKVYGSGTAPSTAPSNTEDAGSAGSADGGGSVKAAALCAPAKAVEAERLPAREAVMSDEIAGDSASDQGVFTQALFDEFIQHCGACHSGTTSQGGLSVTIANFTTKIGSDTLARLKSDVPGVGGFMPPAPDGVPFSTRPAQDQIRAFAERLEQWVQQGRPADVFFPKRTSTASTGSKGTYLLRKGVGMQLTNLGNCIPSPSIMATEQSGMSDLDAKFAAMKSFRDLPSSLAETDMTSFDAEVLARQGVVAFAPAYTLWADNAKKIRMVRVPRGQSIRFDADAQSFTIPANTRFYKTFFKATTDLNGRTRFRKMETRIILSRPARLLDNGTYEQTAIFGTYKWNDTETEATLQDRPYRDGEGFRDEVFPYVVDERKDDEVLRQGPKNQLTARLAAGAMRNYAIPGFDRCQHCHMGSPQQNFVLGFTPLQIHRRPTGEGGVLDAAAEDELNQVQRLLDYGIISGLGSAEEITPLEKSQGDRQPRNEYELTAQGYMLGNCAHCHNPNGFPSIKEPVLRDVLNFLPGTPHGGIFQFPLDKFSPRKFRGDKQDVRVPYITPSLYDPPLSAMGYNQTSTDANLKWISYDQELPPEHWDTATARYATLSADIPLPGWPLLAPWRSLIYRNIDSPFSYQESNAVFPHMPMDTPGYDCRVRDIFGSWMTSIVARWKSDGKTYNIGLDSSITLTSDSLDEAFYGAEPQPYEEIGPDHPDYPLAEVYAASRLKAFKSGQRLKDCPNGDILDPDIAAGKSILPGPQSTKDVIDPAHGTAGHYTLASPALPHYFQTDLRADKSWIIRRGDWFHVLVPGAPDNDADPENNDPYVSDSDRPDWTKRHALLNQIRLTDELRRVALTEVPFGLWVDKPECSSRFVSAGVKRVGDFQDGTRPDWMKYAATTGQDAPVYSVTRGGEVFDIICSKCHGPQADGESTLASTMADMTGGLTRVANLRDGIFGPRSNPGQNRLDPVTGFGRSLQELGSVNGIQLTADDWAARYAVWMGLGGTRAFIPRSVVSSIGITEILGVRSGVKLEAITGQQAANMLEIARLSCLAVAPNFALTPGLPSILFDPEHGQLITDPDLDGSVLESDHSVTAMDFTGGDNTVHVSSNRPKLFFALGKAGVITSNGHAALWQELCRVDNPQPVRVIRYDTGTQRNQNRDAFYVSALYRRSEYQKLLANSNAPAVGDGSGQVHTSLEASNLSPWCVVPPPVLQIEKGKSLRTDSTLVDRFADYQRRTGKTLPMCPGTMEAQDDPGHILVIDSPSRHDHDVDDWALRGAMNAGMSVFLYLDALSKDKVKPVPSYDHCDALSR